MQAVRQHVHAFSFQARLDMLSYLPCRLQVGLFWIPLFTWSSYLGKLLGFPCDRRLHEYPYDMPLRCIFKVFSELARCPVYRL